MKPVLVVLMLIALPPSARAEMNLQQMQSANGLAEIIKRSKPCGFTIDQAGLEKYYVEQKLDNAETLAFIASSIGLADLDDPPTESDCTMARITARSIGVLAQ